MPDSGQNERRRNARATLLSQLKMNTQTLLSWAGRVGCALRCCTNASLFVWRTQSYTHKRTHSLNYTLRTERTSRLRHLKSRQSNALEYCKLRQWNRNTEIEQERQGVELKCETTKRLKKQQHTLMMVVTRESRDRLTSSGSQPTYAESDKRDDDGDVDDWNQFTLDCALCTNKLPATSAAGWLKAADVGCWESESESRQLSISPDLSLSLSLSLHFFRLLLCVKLTCCSVSRPSLYQRNYFYFDSTSPFFYLFYSIIFHSIPFCLPLQTPFQQQHQWTASFPYQIVCSQPSQ